MKKLLCLLLCLLCATAQAETLCPRCQKHPLTPRCNPIHRMGEVLTWTSEDGSMTCTYAACKHPTVWECPRCGSWVDGTHLHYEPCDESGQRIHQTVHHAQTDDGLWMVSEEGVFFQSTGGENALVATLKSVTRATTFGEMHIAAQRDTLYAACMDGLRKVVGVDRTGDTFLTAYLPDDLTVVSIAVQGKQLFILGNRHDMTAAESFWDYRLYMAELAHKATLDPQLVDGVGWTNECLCAMELKEGKLHVRDISGNATALDPAVLR